MHRPDGLVIRVEKVVIALVEQRVVRHVRLQDERFEKPRGVREMPFRWTDVRHALHDIVLGLQGFADRERGRTDLAVCCGRRRGVDSGWYGLLQRAHIPPEWRRIVLRRSG